MLSNNKCVKCGGSTKLQSDPYGTYFSCVMCGAERAAKCPHCATASIDLRPSAQGLALICKACGCFNNMLAASECAKSNAGLVPV